MVLPPTSHRQEVFGRTLKSMNAVNCIKGENKLHNSYDSILFDLDGTLIDPKDGIFGGIRFALDKMGCPIPPASEFSSFVGPPLRKIFGKLLKTDNASRIEQAVQFYREKYSIDGLFENALYPGVAEMLSCIAGSGYTIFLATAKPRVFARQIIEQHALNQYFKGIYGSELDGRFDDKGDLICHLLEQEGVAGKGAVMVGDRSDDVRAALRNGVFCIGVTYGYGSRDELAKAGADLIIDSPEEVSEFCMDG